MLRTPPPKAAHNNYEQKLNRYLEKELDAIRYAESNKTYIFRFSDSTLMKGYSAALKNIPLFIWMILVIYILMSSSYELAAFFVVMFSLYYLVNAKLLCTRCCYFGKPCSFGFSGVVASSLFPQNTKKMGKMECFIVYGLFAATISFPLYYLSSQNFSLMISYSVLTLAFLATHYLLDCRKCQNTGCHINPKCQKKI